MRTSGLGGLWQVLLRMEELGTREEEVQSHVVTCPVASASWKTFHSTMYYEGARCNLPHRLLVDYTPPTLLPTSCFLENPSPALPPLLVFHTSTSCR